LEVVPDGDLSSRHELEECFCIKETLACTRISESYWSIPNFGAGGSQSNVYFSIAKDGALIAKLQNYRIDVLLGLPLYGMTEPWLRFEPARP
jgi:hypothetical protein